MTVQVFNGSATHYYKNVCESLAESSELCLAARTIDFRVALQQLNNGLWLPYGLLLSWTKSCLQSNVRSLCWRYLAFKKRLLTRF